MQRAHGELWPRENNPYWPLPADYGDHAFSKEGRRLARVNACRLQQTPELAVQAWDYFCSYYLRPHSGYDPMFYEDWVPPAAIHTHMVYWFEKWPFTAMAFPRGGGKTTTIRSYALFKVLTNWQFFVNLYVSKYDPFVAEAMDIFKTQLTENRRLMEDFGVLAPKRGQGVWRATSIRLNNGARIRLWAIDGALRGARGHFNNADDIEKDPDTEHPDADTITKLKRKFLKVLLPTLRYAGSSDADRYSSMALTGTMIHQQCLLSHVLSCDDKASPDYDTQFLSVENGGFWKKCNLGQVRDAEGHSVWPEMWSDDALKTKERMMGFSEWSSEYGGDPVSPESPLFILEPQKHEYWIDDVDDYTLLDPFHSRSTVTWGLCSGMKDVHVEPQSQSWAEKVFSLNRIITVDVAKGLQAHHDFSVVHVLGMDHNNDLWSLDLWQDRVSDSVLIDKIWEYAMRWQVQTIGIEAVGLQEQYFHAAQEKATIMLEALGWVPSMRPITHGTVGKGPRIKRLEWRFNYGRIKYPGHRRRQPPYDQLYAQTVRFTEDLGNLKHDDLIDTTEMGQTLLKGQRGAMPMAVTPATPIERMLAGETVIPGTEVPLWSLVDKTKLTTDQFNQLARERRMIAAMAAHEEEVPDEWGYEDAF